MAPPPLVVPLVALLPLAAVGAAVVGADVGESVWITTAAEIEEEATVAPLNPLLTKVLWRVLAKVDASFVISAEIFAISAPEVARMVAVATTSPAANNLADVANSLEVDAANVTLTSLAETPDVDAAMVAATSFWIWFVCVALRLLNVMPASVMDT